MYKHVLYYFLCCIFLFIAACKPATEHPLTDSQRSAITAAVEQSFREFANHFVQLNPDGIMQCFAAEDEIVWAIDGIIFKGRRAVEKCMREELGKIKAWNTMKYGEPHISVLAKNAAVHTIDFDESFTLSDGNIVHLRGVWTNVFRRSDGKWKVVVSAASHAQE